MGAWALAALTTRHTCPCHSYPRWLSGHISETQKNKVYLLERETKKSREFLPSPFSDRKGKLGVKIEGEFVQESSRGQGEVLPIIMVSAVNLLETDARLFIVLEWKSEGNSNFL